MDDKYYKKISVRNPTPTEVAELLFAGNYDFLFYDQSGLYSLGVYGLDEDDQFGPNAMRGLPKWYITYHDPEGLSKVLVELVMRTGFSRGLIIEFIGREGSNIREVSNFVDQICHVFEEVAEVIDISDNSNKADIPVTQSTSRPNLPKSLRAMEKWKKSYLIIQQLNKKYTKLYRDGATENPQPSMEDYVDAIKNKWGFVYSTRTIRKIIKAGDQGYFN
jgi:hypothetical protein